MSRYNREFLVPYLRDVCSCELLIKRLKESIDYNRNRINAIEKKNFCRKPVLQVYEPEAYGMDDFLGDIALISGGVVAAVVLCLITGWFQHAWCLYIIFSPIVIWPTTRIVIGMLDRKACEDEYELEYQEQMEAYNAALRAQKADEPKILAHQEQIEGLKQVLYTVERLLREVYQVNIIPSQYRNIYSAAYLYDWFSTSGADDLDHALSMFVLEEIKERLDVVISQQADMILNQELMFARMQASAEEQKTHNAYMKAKAEQLALTADEHSAYLKMIEANTSATAYFAAADYLRN